MFFWIHFYNKKLLTDWPERIHVSILVFLDSLLQHMPVPPSQHVDHLFQSLFFWIHFYNQVVLHVVYVRHIPFQSLFFWIHFYNRSGCRESSCTYGFQSLFFWIHFYNSTTMSKHIPLDMFQSLFFWIHFYNFVMSLPRFLPLSMVSILVFLDSLLQRQQSHKYF